MWCRRRIEINWTDHVRKEVVHRFNQEINIPHAIKNRKANGIGYILHRKRLLKRVTEVRIERII
jgi:hypothetical protein